MAHTCGVNDALLAAALDEVGKLKSDEVSFFINWQNFSTVKILSRP